MHTGCYLLKIMGNWDESDNGYIRLLQDVRRVVSEIPGDFSQKELGIRATYENLPCKT